MLRIWFTWRPHRPQPHSLGGPYTCSSSAASKLELESEEMSSYPLEARLSTAVWPTRSASIESLLSPF